MTKFLLPAFLFLSPMVSLGQASGLTNVQDVDLSSFLGTDPYLSRVNAFEVEYESDGHLIRGFLFEPASEGPHPLIIFNRGGNRDFASLNIGMMVNYTGQLAANGFVILASNYRDDDEFGGEDLNDVLRLIEIAATIESIDTSRIGMFGWSRGGMMCYLAMARTNRLKTVVVGNGPTNLERTLIERPGLEANVFEKCIPNYHENKESELRKRSVINWPEKLDSASSLLILAGTKDKRVNHSQAKDLSTNLNQLNFKHSLKLFETDHFFSDRKDTLHTELLNWFHRELK